MADTYLGAIGESLAIARRNGSNFEEAWIRARKISPQSYGENPRDYPPDLMHWAEGAFRRGFYRQDVMRGGLG